MDSIGTQQCSNGSSAENISSFTSEMSADKAATGTVNDSEPIRDEERPDSEERSEMRTPDCTDGLTDKSMLSSISNLSLEQTEPHGRDDDEFEPKALRPIDICVTKSEERLDTDDEETYKMGSNPKGYALVISIEKFENEVHEERCGGDIDRKNLNLLLTGLGYDVTVKLNLTKEMIQSAILKFRDDPRNKTVDSSLLFFLSHGEQGATTDINLKTYDNLDINSEWIIEQFYGKYCKQLAGKPKLFFFQSCRGEETDNCARASSTLKAEGGGIAVPNKSDILIVYSCAPGNISLRSKKYGSWLVHFLCEVFMKDAHKEDVSSMLDKVSRKLRECVDELYGGQVLCVNKTGFDKKMFFNPGLYSDK